MQLSEKVEYILSNFDSGDKVRLARQLVTYLELDNTISLVESVEEVLARELNQVEASRLKILEKIAIDNDYFSTFPFWPDSIGSPKSGR